MDRQSHRELQRCDEVLWSARHQRALSSVAQHLCESYAAVCFMFGYGRLIFTRGHNYLNQHWRPLPEPADDLVDGTASKVSFLCSRIEFQSQLFILIPCHLQGGPATTKSIDRVRLLLYVPTLPCRQCWSRNSMNLLRIPGS